MTSFGRKMDSKRKIPVKDLNPFLTCTLCEGYLIDATSLVDCHHVFCRSCILKYFDNCKTGCPTCNTIYKKKTQTCFKSDPQIQSLVYKLVPGLYSKEIQRREDFYRSTAVRASSSCSDDSVLERERDGMQDHEDRISLNIGDKTQFFSPDDSISLSLEYYQPHLDPTSPEDCKKPGHRFLTDVAAISSSPHQTNIHTDSDNNNKSDTYAKSDGSKVKQSEEHKENDSAEYNKDSDSKRNVNSDKDREDKSEATHKNNQLTCDSDDKTNSLVDKCKEQPTEGGVKRYLQCPAAVSMKHLQKFIRMKNALTADNRVDIIYQGEVLPSYFSLMDVAYTFKWNRTKPMRFFYRIFPPLKVRPIKIINTTSSTGGKQLQIVPVKSSSEQHKHPIEKSPKQQEISEEQFEDNKEKEEKLRKLKETEEINNRKEQHELQDKKERLMAHLQLQSKSKVQIKDDEPATRVPEIQTKPLQDCIYTYEEQDKEEIKRFAEKRDREWMLQKQMDEEFSVHHFVKKRKKSKHSKNESMHKKRKLHAEITSNEKEDLKLKVKLTPHNGHKHKHHRSSQSSSSQTSSERTDKSEVKELSSKEKLLQMRQVRHKHVSSEDKNIQTVSPASIITVNAEKPEKTEEEAKKPVLVSQDKCVEAKIELEPKKVPEITQKPIAQISTENNEPKKVKPVETSATTSSGVQTAPQTQDLGAKAAPVPTCKTLRSDFASKQMANREWGAKVPTVQLERNEQTERQAQKTFLKTFQSYAEKYHKNNAEKIQQNKNEAAKMTIKACNLLSKPGMLEKIANLQQRCTIESKPQEKLENKVEKKPAFNNNDKNKTISSPYPPGFTVSKIEAGVKRKAENLENPKDKRPSLEITLINPPVPSPTNQNQKPPEVKPAVKRPPPATIPLERIKKSNLKSGISIIPKMPEKCDNIGALDLSKPNKSPEASPQKPATEIKPINGFNMAAALASRHIHNSTPRPPPNSEKTVAEKNIQLSNLQLLSKVATEHQNSNKPGPSGTPNAKARPQMPNLQTLKIPSLQNPIGPMNKPSNLARMPKLNEINKNFRFPSPQIRNLRPNQNQNIRNIPNPSLLVRQQNQNRLNTMNSLHQNINGVQQKTVQASSANISATTTKEMTDKVTVNLGISIDARISEKKEISVGQ